MNITLSGGRGTDCPQLVRRCAALCVATAQACSEWRPDLAVQRQRRNQPSSAITLPTWHRASRAAECWCVALFLYSHSVPQHTCIRTCAKSDVLAARSIARLRQHTTWQLCAGQFDALHGRRYPDTSATARQVCPATLRTAPPSHAQDARNARGRLRPRQRAPAR